MVLDIAYVAAAAITVAYAAVTVMVAMRGRHDAIATMAGRAFAFAVATAVAASLVGHLVGDQMITLSAVTTAAVPFGVTAAALHALAARGDSERAQAALHAAALAIAAVLPFAAGMTGWS